ncbi:MAG: nucleotide exchange factor GrpE [Acholeplasmataceae bacterium]|nr:nucleotide exchange factor GrpE [Acholeplasmataceae bacterium]
MSKEKDIKDVNEEVLEETKEEVKEEIKEEKEKKPKKKTKQDLEREIDELKLENLRLAEKVLKALADSENYKKRLNHEREIEKKYSNMYLIERLIPSLDQLRLVTSYNVEDEALKNYLIGFKMINDQLYQVLEDDGLKVVDGLNQKFDPKYHHAIEKVCDKERENGIIVSQTQVGYMYKERTIRPAMVVVNEWSDENGNNK